MRTSLSRIDWITFTLIGLGISFTLTLLFNPRSDSPLGIIRNISSVLTYAAAYRLAYTTTTRRHYLLTLLISAIEVIGIEYVLSNPATDSGIILHSIGLVNLLIYTLAYIPMDKRRPKGDNLPSNHPPNRSEPDTESN